MLTASGMSDDFMNDDTRMLSLTEYRECYEPPEQGWDDEATVLESYESYKAAWRPKRTSRECTMTPTQKHVVVAALRFAKEQYERDAAACADAPRAVAQFLRQAVDCEALIMRWED